MLNNNLSTYIERRVSKPFANLKPDEQIVAHWALIYKELLKYNYSSFYDYDLDDISTEQQMSGLTSNKTGGIEWYNYMYSDRYKDDEGLKKDNIVVGGKDPNYWARLSVFGALERFAIANIGDFIVTPQMIEFCKNAVQTDALPKSNIQRNPDKYEQAFIAAQAIKQIFPKMHGHAIISLIGTYAPECGFNFKNSYNVQEYNGTYPKSSANNSLDFGESWCGISHWNTKIKLINATGLNGKCSTNPDTYKIGSGKCICEQSLEDQAKLNCEFLKIQPKWVYEPILEFDPKKHDPNDTVACTFLAKAGCGTLGNRTVWEQAIKRGLDYDHQNNKDEGYHFASPIYHAMMFARYIKDKKVPSGHPWEK